MKLDVSTALRTPGQEYAFHERQAMAPVEVLGETVTLDDIEVSGTFQTMEDGSVTVDGMLKTTAHARCANCLAPASAEVTATFRETFVRGGDPEDDETFAYDGYFVDLDHMVMTYLLLEMPMRFVCGEQCPGMGAWVEGDSEISLYREGELPKTQRPFAGLQQLLAQSGSDEALADGEE